MIAALQRAWANFRGFDLTGSTVPPMDGPLRPNAALDAAPTLLELAEVDNLVARGGSVLCSAGSELLTLATAPDGLVVTDRRDLGHTVTSLAVDASGRVAIALEGQGIQIEAEAVPARTLQAPDLPRGCITAMTFADAATLIVCVGAADRPASEWKRDLMSKSATGSVWRVELDSGRAIRLADGLAFPSGVAVAGGTLYVSEAWRHRVLAIGPDGRPTPAFAALPAYPGRITPAAGGGFWLALFAPRNPLVEFVLREDAYRTRMIETIDPEYWIAPSLATGRSFLEPIQGGARKKLNRLKPWSPTWSTGLLARCDGRMQPQRSLHSRADGHVHGITSMCEAGGRLLVGARGSGKIVAIEDTAERGAA
jgi:hypothetical protein